jgi:hypothetical protein
LITGKLRSTQLVEDESEDKNRQLINYSAGLQNINSNFITHKFLGDYFANRSWKGLDDGYRQDDSLEIKKGLAGTSMGYSSEKS